MGKIQTPDWVLKGKEKPKEKKTKEKRYKIRICPKCKGSEVAVVLTGEEGKGKGEWECKKCKWKGKNIDEKELSEDEFLEHLDKIEGK